jgi:hypothetical protein
MSRVLAYSDPHNPVCHPGAIAFLSDLRDKYDCTKVVCCGDILDHQAISFHAMNPNCPGPKDEYELTLYSLRPWKKAFPEQSVTIGNHDARVLRLAESVNITKQYLREFADVWKTPGWKWVEDVIIDGVYYFHGTGRSGLHPAYNAMKDFLMPVCMGHCLSQDTDLLTEVGWVPVADVPCGRLVATMGGDRSLAWQPVRQKMVDPNARMIQTDFMAYTPEHRVIYETESGHVGERKGAQFRKLGQVKVIRAISNRASPQYRDDFLRLLVWVAADGSYDRYQVRWHLRKLRKITRLCSLLSRAGISFRKYGSTDGTTGVDVHIGQLRPVVAMLGADKTLPWALVGVSEHEAGIVLEEYANTDGCYINDSVQVSCAKRQTIDVLQAMFSVAGMRATSWQRADTGVWMLSVCRRPTRSMVAKEVSTLLPDRQDAFCVSVQNGTLVARRNGKVFVTGNCHSASGVKWSTNPDRRTFGVDLGCLIDVDAFQFAYGKHARSRPVLSAAVVIDGVPEHHVMKCGTKEKYWKGRFDGRRKR